MFDISFTELALAFVVALIVLGPEKLPKVARTVGRWAGQARGYMRNLSTELERETQVREIKQQLQEAKSALREAETAVERESRSIADDVSQDLKPKP
ncbi:Sec-independent protein translocase protein TatB [Panacagrimonas sp.]|uniref:Sec-independent protein translocase protein TatB n=1 Tax=Panacagrimonas sp. TaxID=2480088 RepID=UPI003B523C5C